MRIFSIFHLLIFTDFHFNLLTETRTDDLVMTFCGIESTKTETEGHEKPSIIALLTPCPPDVIKNIGEFNSTAPFNKAVSFLRTVEKLLFNSIEN